MRVKEAGATALLPPLAPLFAHIDLGLGFLLPSAPAGDDMVAGGGGGGGGAYEYTLENSDVVAEK